MREFPPGEMLQTLRAGLFYRIVKLNPLMSMTQPCLLLLSAICLTLSSGDALGKERLAPTHKDVAYDDGDPAQCLDFYRAKSGNPVPVIVHIHGGGWHAGSKSSVPYYLLRAVEEGWVSVASVEYRFTNVATHPAQGNDCLRAVQFLRTKASEWNFDPLRIGVTGGSAGGHLSLWVALHDDVADAKSEDPVERESSRVLCAVGFAGPTDWSLLGEIEHQHPGYLQLIDSKPGTPFAQNDKEKMDDVSPVFHASSDDPAILIVHGNADDVVPFAHAERLNAALRKVEVKSELYTVEGGNHGVAGAGEKGSAARATAFFKAHLLPAK